MRASERRGLPSALAALIALIAIAWLVARSDEPAMTVLPGVAAPGSTVTVSFLAPHPPPRELVLERGGEVLLLTNDQLTEVDDARELVAPDNEVRRTLAFLRHRGPAPLGDQLQLSITALDLPSRATGSGTFTLVSPDVDETALSSSSWEITLPFELGRGTYRACTLGDADGAKLCAPLTVGYGG